ncbi:MAG: conjugal transfer protein MobB [Rikenellaceae bacterium]
MVANIGSSSSLGGALGYNMRKVEKGEAKILATNGISCPQGEEFSRTDIMRDFELHMPQRYRTENPVFHVSLNPHPDDILSDVELSTIAEEYMERMGYGSQPYIIYKHEDIDRHHIHALSVRVDSDGKKINDKFERRRSKTITRDLEQKYGLRTAEKQSKTQKTELQMVIVSMGDVKSQVENVVRGVNEKYHFASFAEYNAVLSKLNVVAEETKGALYGKAYSGVIYSATDSDNNKIGNPFPSTALGKFAGIKALERKYITSKELLRDGKFARQLQGKIDKSFIGATTLGQLRINLYDNSVGVVYRESAEGRLYGVTYIDHTTGAILNGSQIGKNYSANMVVERLRNPNPVAHQYRFRIPNKLGDVTLTEQQRVTLDLGESIYMENMTNRSGDMMNAYVKCNEETGAIQFFRHDPDIKNVSQPPQQQQSPPPAQEREQSQEQTSSFVSGGLGLFDPLCGSRTDIDDIENEQMARNLKPKKKQRGRRL